MSKRIIYFLIPFILGCNFLFPPKEDAGAPLTQPASATAQSVMPTSQADLASSFTINRIHKSDGDLNTQLAIEAQKAKALNQTPILEFDATWCPPCIAIEKSLNAKEQITLNAFAGTYIIRADVDEWGWGDKNKFKFDGIPIYYKLDANGSPTGAFIDGSAWGDNIPENFAPVLDQFFHTQ